MGIGAFDLLVVSIELIRVGIWKRKIKMTFNIEQIILKKHTDPNQIKILF